MAEGTAPTLLFVVGPPAVGKMTVGREISKRTGLRLFHHHLSAELVLPFFDFGSPAFDRLADRFRRHLIEEVAASDRPGLIFTYVWAYDLPGEQKTLERYAHLFQRRGGRVLYAELQASQEERLNRNAGASRLSAKPSKRNIEASRRHLLEAARYRLDSAGEFDGRPDYLRIETTHLSPADVVTQIIDHFGLAPGRGRRP